MTYQTREEWLIRAMELIGSEIFDDRGYTLPDRLMISTGFPKGSGRGCKAIGQCWDPRVTKDDTTHIFICPTLSDAMRVLDVIVHELVHAIVGCKEGHKGQFKKLATEVGLEGKMTATFVTPGSDLHRKLASIFTKLGKYPHSALHPRDLKVEDPKEPGEGGEAVSAWATYVSQTNKDFRLRIRKSVVETHGAPVTPWGEEMVEKEQK